MYPGAAEDGDASNEPFRVREVWPPGTVIKGDFSIQRRLGGGGFGTVYIARHRFLGTTHVIKRLHEQYASDPDYTRRFFNEGRAIRRLKGCPHIVEVEHMTQSEDGYLILVMEFVPGGDLAGLMESRTLTIREAIEFGQQIAMGLEAAHNAGLIHRDIKPQNVLVGSDSTGRLVLKLIDFGIAADHADSNRQTSVMRGGSIGFAAPEQWMQAGKHLDGRTDLYSLGVTLYRMICGQMPFADVSGDDIVVWMDRVRRGPPVPAMSLRPECPRGLSDLIQELLSFHPKDRPADAGVVISRLRELSVAPAEPAVRPPLPEIRLAPPPALPPPPLAQDALMPLQFTTETRDRRTWLVGGIAAIGVLSVAAALTFHTPAAKPEPKPPQAEPAPSNAAAEPKGARPAATKAGGANRAVSAEKKSSTSGTATPERRPVLLPKDAPDLRKLGPVTLPSPSSPGDTKAAEPETAVGEVFRSGNGVTAPVLISRSEPAYTEMARKAKLQGTVVLVFVVDPEGVPIRIKVLRPLGLGLDEKAVEAVSKWRFKPGMKDGQPVPVQVTATTTFRLL